MNSLDFSIRFTKYVDEGNYRNVRRYLDNYVFDFHTYNKVVYMSVIKGDDKMFDILISDILVLYYMTFECCYFIITHKEKYERVSQKPDYLPYVKTIIKLKPTIVNGISSQDQELLDLYKQISRLKKFYRIRKKMYNLK